MKNKAKAFGLAGLLIGLLIRSPLAVGRAGPTEGRELMPVSGADGAFETVRLDGTLVHRSLQESNGSWAPYMYFQLPEGAAKAGQAAYVEVRYKDVGTGRLSLQYNGQGARNVYQEAAVGYARLLADMGVFRTAVFKLPAPDFRHGQNLGADLRLCSPDKSVRLHIVRATLSWEPTVLFQERDARPWLQPYRGPMRQDVNALTLHKKVLCGYQGWFRCPGDAAERGWVHWSRDSRRLGPDTLSFEMWPDLSEFSDEEKYPAPGFSHQGGKPAFLFSSANQRTVERHFDWMRKYGIDGALVQRFVAGVADPESTRVLGYARAAANRTGRVFAVEYDMTGTPPDKLFDLLTRDWKWLVDEMKITDDPRYLHHNGKPVLAVWGFFSDRFEAALAHRIIDFFKLDKRYGVTLIGGCQWPWREEKNAAWAKVFRRFDVINPWNVGNSVPLGGRLQAKTEQWPGDLSEARRAGMLFMPVVFPGFSWDNLQRKAPGSTNIPRLRGQFYWEQFSTVARLGIDVVKVAMFDEVDEGTAIFKVSNTPPRQGHFVTYEGMPSDWYLRLTGEGAKLIRRERTNMGRIPIRP